MLVVVRDKIEVESDFVENSESLACSRGLTTKRVITTEEGGVRICVEF